MEADDRRWSSPGSGLARGPTESRKEYRIWPDEEKPPESKAREAGLTTHLTNASVLDDVFKCHTLKKVKERVRLKEKRQGKQQLVLEAALAAEEDLESAGICTSFTNAQIMEQLMMDGHIKEELADIRRDEMKRAPPPERWLR
eukprot:TRINITY_DN82044_c0_g1_i1.p1 TRINITY_DN82044_c0_g1~~TRINITY_DN82044_c0_g1_i1.p1  ORF type:complete len:143 (+),score=45.00 TRINITY_DN82044_c0_g1_i1:77-505(+)